MSWSLPVLEFTWQTVLNLQAGLSSTTDADNKDIMFKIKSTLTGFAQNPWVVVSSCDSTQYGAADYWISSANLVWSLSGNRSWIVLENIDGAQICIELQWANAYSYYAHISFSPAGLFTSGALNAKPIASDETVITSNPASYADFWGGRGTAGSNRLHAWHSTDGKHTRLILCNNSISNAFFYYDSLTVQNGVTWTTPSICRWFGHTTNDVILAASLMSNTAGYCAHAGVLSGHSWAREMASTTPQDINVNMDTTSARPILAVTGVWSFTSGVLGKWSMPSASGRSAIPDLFLGGTGVVNGTGYLNGSAVRTWVQFGDIVLPWDGSTVLIS
jgi:hypothetical protein